MYFYSPNACSKIYAIQNIIAVYEEFIINNVKAQKRYFMVRFEAAFGSDVNHNHTFL